MDISEITSNGTYYFSGVMIIEVGIEFIQKKKIEVKILNWLCQFLWILIVVSIVKNYRNYWW